MGGVLAHIKAFKPHPIPHQVQQGERWAWVCGHGGLLTGYPQALLWQDYIVRVSCWGYTLCGRLAIIARAILNGAVCSIVLILQVSSSLMVREARHTHTHVRTHARTHAHTHTYTTHAHAHTHTQAHTHTHTQAHTHTHTHTHAHTHRHTCTHTHTRTHTHTHTHTGTQAHTHTQARGHTCTFVVYFPSLSVVMLM